MAEATKLGSGNVRLEVEGGRRVMKTARRLTCGMAKEIYILLPVISCVERGCPLYRS